MRTNNLIYLISGKPIPTKKTNSLTDEYETTIINKNIDK